MVHNKHVMTNKNNLKGYFMWIWPALFLANQFIFRIWPGLMSKQIMAQLHIDNQQFGLINAAYYYGYALMQIPMAIVLDHFGAKRSIFFFATLCGLSTLLFSFTDSFWIAILSRFFVGASSAVGFLGASKVISQWFDKKDYTRMIGVTVTLGLAGAVFGGYPVSKLVDMFSWQSVVIALAFGSIALGLGALLFVDEPEKTIHKKQGQETGFKLTHLTTILKSKTLWILGIVNFLLVGVLEGFADVWGIPYLVNIHCISADSATQIISWVYMGLMASGLILPALGRFMGEYAITFACGIGMALSLFLILFAVPYHAAVFAGILGLAGLCSGYQTPLLSMGARYASASTAVLSVAFLNCMNMLGGSFFHTLIGMLMQNGQKEVWVDSTGGAPVQALGDKMGLYEKALSIIPLSCITGLIVLAVFLIFNRNKKV